MAPLRSGARAALAVTMLASSVSAFYMPGVQPETFLPGAEVKLKVNSMTSIHTQLPKDYYRLPFCKPTGGPKMASENLGEFLAGDKIQSSPYHINMLKEMYCSVLCQVALTKLEAAKLTLHIKYGYHHNWIIDNLPSAAIGLTTEGETTHYSGGFPMGFISTDSKDAYIYNHVNIIIDYHKPLSADEGFRVVGFAVEPMSIAQSFSGGYQWDGETSDGYTKPLESCGGTEHMTSSSVSQNQIVKPGEKIIYTYDVIWKESDVPWASRWDIYLNENHLVPPQVHWYSITNSILVVLFLSLLVVSILVRNLKRDIAGYNALSQLTDEEQDDEVDESGWKLVHADVFRPPSTYPMVYCVFLGSGVQIAIATLLGIVFSAMGFLNPARRGSLMIGFLVFYMICGSLAGYVSSRLYKSFKGRQWQMCTVLTATCFPGCGLGVFLFFNVILYFFHSTGSVPFLDIIILAAMWCCVSIPLVFLGAYFGYKKDAITYPCVTSTIARAIPEQPPMMDSRLAIAFAGIIPFAAAYVELFFIMTSLWMDQFYYVFGFTFIVYVVLLVTCAEVTVLLCYYQLCAENHRWWWFSFLTSGSASFYVLVYSAFWFRSLEASKMVVTYLLYFGYMFLLSFAMLLVTGTVGSLSCFWFVRKIFSTIKVD